MSNKYKGLGTPYFQVPHLIASKKLLREMSKGDLLLYMLLSHKLNLENSVRFEVSASEIGEVTGLSINAIKRARERLRELRLITFDRARGAAYVYQVCNPSTGDPLPEFDRNRIYEPPTDDFLNPTRNTVWLQARGKDIHTLSEEQFRRYFTARLKQELDAGVQIMVHCPFHDDSDPSCSLNLERGLLNCHACVEGWDILGFEQKFSSCERYRALENIAAIAGAPEILRRSVSGKDFSPDASYPYTDEKGNLLFMVFRFNSKQGDGTKNSKKFLAARLGPRDAWWFHIKGVRRPLYNLPAVIAADLVIVTEGEKCADVLSAFNLRDTYGKPIAVTTCPFGSKKNNWTDEFSKVLTGKRVVILPDADKAGKAHAARVHAAVAPYAQAIRLIEWQPNELNDKEDIVEYLERYSVETLMDRMGRDWFLQSHIVSEESFMREDTSAEGYTAYNKAKTSNYSSQQGGVT